MSNSKKRASATISFIKATNPEIFKIHPRAGGLVPIESSIEFNECDVKSSTKNAEAVEPDPPKVTVDETISKEFKIQTALDETESIDSADATVPNPVKDAMFMFGIAISSLMSMAGDQTLSEEHLQWTTHCLECVKDDFGNHPPNVQGILNHIKSLNGQKGGDDGAGGGADDQPPQAATATDASENVENTEENTDNADGGNADNVNATDETVENEGGDQTIRTTTRVNMGSQGGEDD